MTLNDLEVDNSSLYKKKRRWKIANETGKCTICPPHGGENKTRHRPRPDKYKNKRR